MHFVASSYMMDKCLQFAIILSVGEYSCVIFLVVFTNCRTMFATISPALGGGYNGNSILTLRKRNKAKLKQLQLSAAASLLLEVLLDVSQGWLAHSFEAHTSGECTLVPILNNEHSKNEHSKKNNMVVY